MQSPLSAVPMQPPQLAAAVPWTESLRTEPPTTKLKVGEESNVTIFSLGLGLEGGVDPLSGKLYAEGQPAYLRVCRTFLDVAPPEPEMMRARTAPDASTVYTDSAEEDDNSSVASATALDFSAVSDAQKEDAGDDEDDDSDAPPPQMLTLEHFATPDWYDNPYACMRSPNTWDPLLALPRGLASLTSPHSKPGSRLLPHASLTSLPESFEHAPGAAMSMTEPVLLPPIQAPLYPAPSMFTTLESHAVPPPPAERPMEELCVKHTFLEICPAPPAPELLRGSTAPATSGSCRADDSVPEVDAMNLSMDTDSTSDDEEDAAAPPPFLPEHFATPEWYGEFRSPQEPARAPMASLQEAPRWIPSVPEVDAMNLSTDADAITSDDDEDDAAPPPFLPEHFATPEWYGELLNTQESQELAWTPMPSLQEATRWTPTREALPVPPVLPPAQPAVSSAKLPSAPPPIWAAPLAPLRLKDETPAPPSGDADDEYPCCEGASKMPGLTLVACDNGKTYVFWAVDARKLDSQDKQAVSPQFDLDLQGEEGLKPFRFVMHPTVKNDGRRGGGFKKSKGKGHIELKCETPRGSDAPDVVFRFAVGRGASKQPFRADVAHNFSDSSCCGLPDKVAEWDFSTAVDDSKTCLIILEVSPFKTA